MVGSITGVGSGNFTQGYKTGVTPIAWPTPARISLMQQYAQDADAANGDYDLTSLHDRLAACRACASSS